MIDENLQLVGIWFSIVSLFTTLGLAWYIYHLDKKQRERDETFYVTTTMRDIKGLKEHLINIHNISESEEPIPSNDEKIDISQRLAEYTKRNEKIIEVFIFFNILKPCLIHINLVL